ncbi:MAG: hypothetical protein K6G22_01270 [Lachnospiraceae bacterium]|nr:hypothetical protein [Lachnospiraceae bacterium]
MDELSLKKELLRIRALAKSQDGCISKEQITDHLSPSGTDEGSAIKKEHLELIYDYLREENIRVFENETERLKDKTDKGNNKTDTVRMTSGSDESRKKRLKSLESVLKKEKDAAEVFTEIYLDTVNDIARLYEGQGVFTEDLVGEGNIALLLAAKAVEICDSAEEVDELVTRMIMDAMEKCIMDDIENDSFMDEVLLRVNRLNDAARELSEDLERKITIEELAKELSMDVSEIRETIYLSGNNIEYIEGDGR